MQPFGWSKEHGSKTDKKPDCKNGSRVWSNYGQYFDYGGGDLFF